VGFFRIQEATMRRVFIPAVAVGVLLVCVTTVFAQKTKKDDKDTGKKVEKAYILTDIDQLRRFPDVYKDRDLRLQDRFGELTNIYPRTLQRKGVTPAKFLEFTTSSATGSNMTCYVEKSNKDSINLVSKLVKEDPVTLEGTVYGVVNNMQIFTVDRVYSGYQAPKSEGKPQITMVIQWQGDSTEADPNKWDTKKYQYMITKPGLFVITDPATNKKIAVEFKY
jgi:hypothetical protein